MSRVALQALLEHNHVTMALRQVEGLLGWDQETMMPKAGGAQRAEQAAAISGAIHTRETDPRIGDWLAAVNQNDLDDLAKRNVAEIDRRYTRATKLPADLSAEIARVTSAAQGIWADARAANKFADFAPTLEQVLKLRREEAACLATEGQSHYDALLQEYEPGMDTATLSGLLESMRPRLSALRAAIDASGRSVEPLRGSYPKAAQLALSAKVAAAFTYNFDAGRLDLAVHPFSSGDYGDVRITTRVDEAEPLGCIYSTIHEVGHAVYEQNIAKDYRYTPVGHHASMGVHESQSRMFENQIGRSRAFAEWLFPEMREAFAEFNITSPQGLYEAVNRVETGFIRTEADEVHYNLHILLRFELERDLIGGDLEVGTVEAEWNRRFERDFGRAVPDAARGVLQDVHWSVGLFGYFPTYSLGNIYAAQQFVRMREDIPDLDGHVAKGNIKPLADWVGRKVHAPGNLLPPSDLMERVTGAKADSTALLEYLEAKFTDMYRL